MTNKQQLLIQYLPEFTGSKAKLLRKAGYSESTARKPAQVFRSLGIENLIAQGEIVGLGDQYCLSRVKAAMDSRDYSHVTAAIRLWWSIKYPNTKKSDNPSLNQVGLAEYGLQEQLDDAIYLIKKSGLSRQEILKLIFES